MEEIGLAEAIAALRKEITVAVEAGADDPLKFEVGEVMIEFAVGLERETDGGGGLNIWVLTLGGHRSRTNTQTHRLTVPLKPVRRDGTAVLIGETHLPD